MVYGIIKFDRVLNSCITPLPRHSFLFTSSRPITVLFWLSKTLTRSSKTYGPWTQELVRRTGDKTIKQEYISPTTLVSTDVLLWSHCRELWFRILSKGLSVMKHIYWFIVWRASHCPQDWITLFLFPSKCRPWRVLECDTLRGKPTKTNRRENVSV